MGYKHDPRYNTSGCVDLTAYGALQHVRKEELGDSADRFRKLLEAIRRDCELYNFKLGERVVLIDKVTRKEYR